MRSTVRLGQVVKWPFLMAWSKVFLNGLKSVVWCHLASSGLLLSAVAFSSGVSFFLGGRSGLLVRLTYHMPDVFYQLPSNIVIQSLTTLR